MLEKQRGLPFSKRPTAVTNDNNLARPSEPPTPAGRAQRIIESRELFGTENEILISHDGAIYRMKITRQGKLILNK
ncbi:hemin uptake protein HemP [Ensifer adhaerens]|uniref:hemin uptake protein HemP n=1 Tax=Ensifer adhaerens TaxID=106592 RepID=UPI000CF047B3|nr:hemin uptake protein HemP [Ensifer adhaerens]